LQKSKSESESPVPARQAKITRTNST